VFVQTRAPVNAVTARLIAYNANGIKGSPHYFYITEAAITTSTLNLLDDASFEETTSGNAIFWTATGGAGFTSPAIQPPSYAFSATAAVIGYLAAGNVKTSYLLNLGDRSTTNYLYAHDIYGAGSYSAIFGANTAGLTGTSAWQRVSGSFTGAGFGSTPAVVEYLQSAAVLQEIDNCQLEVVWPFVGGTLGYGGGYTAGTALPQFCNFAGLTSGALLGAGNFWTCPSGGTATLGSNTVSNSATANCLTCSAASNGGTNYIEHHFTVSGYSQFTFALDAYMQSCTGQVSAQFFDAAGIELSSSNTGGVFNSPLVIWNLTSNGSSAPANGTATHYGTNTITVPTNAAYCRLTIKITSDNSGNAGNGYITNPVVTPTGSLAPSTPWLDGGWSQGGILQNAASYSQPLETQLVRSPSILPSTFSPALLPNNAGFVRLAPNAAASGEDVLQSADFQGPFTDYEFIPTDTGVTQSLYYSVNIIHPDGQFAPMSQQITLTSGSSFSTTNWMLMDPLIPADNISLQVKTAKMETAENQSVMMPAGRGRKLVVSDTQIFGDTITLDVLTISQADYHALRNQLSKAYPLLLKSPDGEMWYVRMTKRSRERVWQGNYARAYRTYTLVMEQVAAVA